MCVVSFQARYCRYYDEYAESYGDAMGIVDILLMYLERFSRLCAAAICFDDLEQLLESMTRYRPIRLDPHGNGHRFILVYQSHTNSEANGFLRETKDEWIAIDPVTYLPTGT